MLTFVLQVVQALLYMIVTNDIQVGSAALEFSGSLNQEWFSCILKLPTYIFLMLMLLGEGYLLTVEPYGVSGQINPHLGHLSFESYFYFPYFHL